MPLATVLPWWGHPVFTDFRWLGLGDLWKSPRLQEKNCDGPALIYEDRMWNDAGPVDVEMFVGFSRAGFLGFLISYSRLSLIHI